MIILGCHTIQNPHIFPFLILYRSGGNYKCVLILACMCARTHASVVSNSLQSHGLQLLCSWNFPGKNTGMYLLQGIFPTGIEPKSLESPALAGRFFTSAPPGKHSVFPSVKENSNNHLVRFYKDQLRYFCSCHMVNIH